MPPEHHGRTIKDMMWPQSMNNQRTSQKRSCGASAIIQKSQKHSHRPEQSLNDHRKDHMAPKRSPNNLREITEISPKPSPQGNAITERSQKDQRKITERSQRQNYSYLQITERSQKDHRTCLQNNSSRIYKVAWDWKS